MLWFMPLTVILISIFSTLYHESENINPQSSYDDLIKLTKSIASIFKKKKFNS